MSQDELILRALRRILQRQADMLAMMMGVNQANEDLIEEIDIHLEAYREANHG